MSLLDTDVSVSVAGLDCTIIQESPEPPVDLSCELGINMTGETSLRGDKTSDTTLKGPKRGQKKKKKNY